VEGSSRAMLATARPSYILTEQYPSAIKEHFYPGNRNFRLMTVVRRMSESYSTLNPVSTGMGDRHLAGIYHLDM